MSEVGMEVETAQPVDEVVQNVATGSERDKMEVDIRNGNGNGTTTSSLVDGNGTTTSSMVDGNGTTTSSLADGSGNVNVIVNVNGSVRERLPNGKLKDTRPSGSKHYIFTWWTDDLTLGERWFQFFQDISVRGGYQYELGPNPKFPGQTGRHLQGYIELTHKRRFTEFTPDKRIHWSTIGKKWGDYEHYGLKDRTRDPENLKQWYWGGLTPPEVLSKVTLDEIQPWARALLPRYHAKPSKFDRTVDWYWEPVGGTGKTQFAKYLVDNHNALLVAGKPADALYAVAQYVQTKGHGPTVVVVDLPRAAQGLSFIALEKIKDGAFFSSKYEASMTRINTPHIICLANFRPNEAALSLDRWNIVRITPDMNTSFSTQ